MKKFLPLIIFLVLIVPVLSYGAGESSLLPNCGTIEGTKINRECGYQDLLQLTINIIDWVMKMAIPISAGVIAWAGFKYMTTGIVDERTAAKTMLLKVAKGLFFIFAAWLIVHTVLTTLLDSSNTELIKVIPVE
jgi:hypothetical protein